MPDTAFERHDHAGCVHATLAAADAHCAREGLRFTRVRRRVLELLLRDHRALGAYDILADLAAEGLGSQPPVAYRALDFLTRIGFAHRIENRNAYVACTNPDRAHAPAFLICRACNRVAETEARPLAQMTDAGTGFHIERAVIEAEGLCAACHRDGAVA